MVSGIARALNLLLAHRFIHPLQKNQGGFRAFATGHELAQFRIIEFNLTSAQRKLHESIDSVGFSERCMLAGAPLPTTLATGGS